MPLRFGLNHMTTPQLDYKALIALAKRLGIDGIELRNDFSHRSLFEGDAPEIVKVACDTNAVSILALSEVKMFNRWSDAKRDEAESLMKTAVAAGIPSISLIPANDGQGLCNGERQAQLRLALRELKPMLETYQLIGNVEPLGFLSSSVRHKPEVIDAIEAVGGAYCYKLVHDTFHHTLSGDEILYPEYTSIVHISGVSNQMLAIHELSDGDRILVDAQDRLGNLEQIRAFAAAGWNGYYSFEPFSKDIHELDDPEYAIRASINFINSELSRQAA